jgi:hypothetical protein
MWFFTIGIITGLILSVLIILRSKIKDEKVMVWTTLSVIVLYRVVTALTIRWYGTTNWWQQISTDSFNHYQLGLILLICCVFLRKYLDKRKLYVLMGISFGWIIDEISDLLKLVPLLHLPTGFRDSLYDLLLISVTYILFVILVKIFSIKSIS